MDLPEDWTSSTASALNSGGYCGFALGTQNLLVLRIYRPQCSSVRGAGASPILLNNIYGVDIDQQAVEVTKLSLLLKVLEGESQDTLQKHLFDHHERALPDLASNIKCGNSLIGPDFYEGQQLTMFDAEERYRINVFDW